MTDWKQWAQAHEMEVPEFPFASGESKKLKLHCWTLGSLNAARNKFCGQKELVLFRSPCNSKFQIRLTTKSRLGI